MRKRTSVFSALPVVVLTSLCLPAAAQTLPAPGFRPGADDADRDPVGEGEAAEGEVVGPVLDDADERFRFAIDVVIDGVLGRASRR